MGTRAYSFVVTLTPRSLGAPGSEVEPRTRLARSCQALVAKTSAHIARLSAGELPSRSIDALRLCFPRRQARKKSKPIIALEAALILRRALRVTIPHRTLCAAADRCQTLGICHL